MGQVSFWVCNVGAAVIADTDSKQVKINGKNETDNADHYLSGTEPKKECQVHCHTATIFEVAGAIWRKFFND